MEVNNDGRCDVRRSTIAIVWLGSQIQIARIYEHFTSRLQTTGTGPGKQDFMVINPIRTLVVVAARRARMRSRVDDFPPIFTFSPYLLSAILLSLAFFPPYLPPAIFARDIYNIIICIGCLP